jgi:NitT/TauT family transport system substrate-binding protein
MRTLLWKECLIGVAALLSLGTVAGAQELKTVNFMASNDYSCSPFPEMNAQVFGFWEDQGIQVNMLSSDTTVPYVAFLQNGDADVAMLDPSQVLQARESNLPIKVIYEAYQNTPEGIVVVDDSPIKSLADLHDVTIGLASDRDLSTTIISLDSIGKTIEDSNIETVVVGDNGPIFAKALQDKTIDAFAGGSSDRGALEALGVKFRNITPTELTRNPGNNFAVWADTLEEKRPILTAFLKGWAMAQLAGVIDTKASASACRTKVPEAFDPVQAGVNLMNNNIYGLQLRRTQKFGELQPDVWNAMQPPFVKVGDIKAVIDPATFLDSSFIDGANDFTTDDVKKKINAWKEANPDKLIP